MYEELKKLLNMGENKPFICTYKDCLMAFTNDDHLEVHMKKHEMALNLGTDMQNNTTTDQTPTPTRFIRNCEAVGLFQDLQNVNPFDETFRKATELAKTGTLHLPQVASDDTLHTPHFSPSIDSSSSTVTKFNQNNCDDVESKEQILLDFPEFQSKSTDNVINESFDIQNNVTKNQKVPEHESNKIIKQNFHSKLICNKKINILSKTKLKQTVVLEKRLKSDDVVDLESDKSLSCNEVNVKANRKYEASKKRLIIQEKQNRKDRPNSKKGAYQAQLDRQREINRVAQTKYRRKKKFWNVQLEEQVKELQKDNEKYLTENENLKCEINLLKSILSCHEDCSASQNPTTIEKVKLLTLEAKRKKNDKRLPGILSRKSDPASSQTSLPVIKKILPIAPSNSGVITLTPFTNAVLIPISLSESNRLQSVPITCSISNDFMKTSNLVESLKVSVNPKNSNVPNIIKKDSKSLFNKLNCVQRNTK